MSEQVQLTGYERDALNAVIAAGGSMGGFEFLGHSDVGTLLKLVNSGLVYLHKGNVVVHKSTLDLATELDTLRAENARLVALVETALATSEGALLAANNVKRLSKADCVVWLQRIIDVLQGEETE